MKIFRMVAAALVLTVFIARRRLTVLIPGVHSVDNLPDLGIDFLIAQNLLGGVYDENVCSCFLVKTMLELPPTLADAPFEQIALYSSFEELLRYGNENSIAFLSGVIHVYIADIADVSMSALGKKSVNAFLAAQSFLFGKGIRPLLHFSFWK